MSYQPSIIKCFVSVPSSSKRQSLYGSKKYSKFSICLVDGQHMASGLKHKVREKNLGKPRDKR